MSTLLLSAQQKVAMRKTVSPESLTAEFLNQGEEKNAACRTPHHQTLDEP